MVGEYLYLSATVLNPCFKLAWDDQDDTDSINDVEKKNVLEKALGFIPNGDNPAESQPELSETELIQSRVMLIPPL